MTRRGFDARVAGAPLMELHFEADLDYQREAVDAVCDLFRGQDAPRAAFSVTAADGNDDGDGDTSAARQMPLGVAETALAVGNRLALEPAALARNLAEVQARGGLAPSGALASTDFTVEMETGTGKTYVYLRTIFELHRRYGFTKFVIVVPSVAIKEGVHKTLDVTRSHFRRLYDGVPFDYFLYDSTRLGQVRRFATSATVQIMVATVAAINRKDVNNLYKPSEKTGGEKPIDLIRATRPILIVDEPQSVDGGLDGRGKEALEAMAPLCTLRYSATHADLHQMVYRLDAVDAYERRLVKQIEVASATVEDAHNKPYVRLVSVSNRRGTIAARVELDVATPAGVERQTVSVGDGDLLERVTRRAVYGDYRIGEIDTTRGGEFVELRYPGGETFLAVGDAHGDVDPLAIQREMIRRTIREHLDKELRLKPLGVKVLSLFFVDSVERYRRYEPGGRAVKGAYAEIFEDEYRRAAKLPAYRALFTGFDAERDVAAVHDGYFSIDRKGGWTETSDSNASGRENAERAYGLIMREKERLLSFATPLRFIFSHSALKEGWDNPNVFQICTLRDIRTERERRQTIGRGLRLAVDQRGERVRGFDVNTLTVIATESYEQFAAHLQKEIEADTGIRFGVVDTHQFAALPVTRDNGTLAPLGVERSAALWTHLHEAGFVDAQGKVLDALKIVLKGGVLPLPAAFEPLRQRIVELLRKLSGRLDVRNADDRRQLEPRRGADGEPVIHGEAFRALWARVQARTTYRVSFDDAALVAACVEALRAAPEVPRARLQWRKADISIGKAGVEATETASAGTVVLDEGDLALPDLLTELQERTQLTRRTLAAVLADSGRLDDFRVNPQAFIALVADAVNRCKRQALIDGITYQRIGDGVVWPLARFIEEPVIAYRKDLREDLRKSVYTAVEVRTVAERAFVDALEATDAVRLYAKLPAWFRIPTPLGDYRPDWLVLVEPPGAPSQCYVVEMDNRDDDAELRGRERRKVQCGEAHFRAIAGADAPVHFVRARTVDALLGSTGQTSFAF
ncbi:type III restriction system endonuclease [Burkholderia plantarii]|nr:type III restriction system endonuclease [Burkholderia plantarii]